ncbi:hypothetical protein, partial [Hahella sp. HN01]|uniref:hypothetical protein n=1 Tax=Hahella sp. HN01 TaxID=2847262 RepID=UPI001C1F0AE6
MQIPLLSIDKNYESLNDAKVTAKVIDSYICARSLNLLGFPKRKEHILELVTHKLQYWERLIAEANELFWLKNEGRGCAVFYPNQNCGYTRVYIYKPTKEHDIRRDQQWNIGTWRSIQSETSLLDILSSIECLDIFYNWKAHQLQINSVPTEFADGRISNTAVDKVMILPTNDRHPVKRVHYATEVNYDQTENIKLQISPTLFRRVQGGSPGASS